MEQNNPADFDGELTDFRNCMPRKVAERLWECQTGGVCKFALPFGYGKFCKHPDVQQIAEQARKKLSGRDDK